MCQSKGVAAPPHTVIEVQVQNMVRNVNQPRGLHTTDLACEMEAGV